MIGTGCCAGGKGLETTRPPEGGRPVLVCIRELSWDRGAGRRRPDRGEGGSTTAGGNCTTTGAGADKTGFRLLAGDRPGKVEGCAAAAPDLPRDRCLASAKLQSRLEIKTKITNVTTNFISPALATVWQSGLL